MGRDATAVELVQHRLTGVLKGNDVFHQGDPADAVFRVEHGCVRLHLDDEAGYRQVIAFIFPGQAFCVGQETRWASATAVTDSVLTKFSKEALWNLAGVDTQAAMSLLLSSDQLLIELAQHLNRLTHLPAPERMTWFLGWLAQHNGADNDERTFDLPMSRQDIADFLGIAPETVSRLVRQLTTDGKLRQVGKRRYRYTEGRVRYGDRSNAVSRYSPPYAGAA